MDPPSDLISRHIMFYPQHITFLETIDDNISTATRKAITVLMQQKQNIKIERQLLIFAIGLMFIGISTVVAPPLPIVFIIAGVAYLGIGIGNILMIRRTPV